MGSRKQLSLTRATGGEWQGGTARENLSYGGRMENGRVGQSERTSATGGECQGGTVRENLSPQAE